MSVEDETINPLAHSAEEEKLLVSLSTESMGDTSKLQSEQEGE